MDADERKYREKMQAILLCLMIMLVIVVITMIGSLLDGQELVEASAVYPVELKQSEDNHE